MSDNEFNLGILIGSAIAALSVLAALAALYLWAVNRTKQRLNDTATPQERAVLPWLTPLLLPTLIILGLGIIANLAKAYLEKRWPEPTLVPMLCGFIFMFLFWLKIRKQTGSRVRHASSTKTSN